jgi:hypothetical protein
MVLPVTGSRTIPADSGGSHLDTRVVRRDEIRRITRRYLTEDELDAYVAEWSHLRSIVCIRPAAIRAWRRGY